MSGKEFRQHVISSDHPLRLILGTKREIASGHFQTELTLGNPNDPIISEGVIEIIRKMPMSEETRQSLLERADQLNRGLDVEIDVPELHEDF